MCRTMKESASAHPSTAIRDAREKLGLSREGLAFKAGVSLRSIERIESGETEPRRATLAVIETALKQAQDEDRQPAETPKAAA
jgi:predicted transcriptional regulator